MSTYVSAEGLWYPGKEKVGLVNKSKKTIKIDGKDIKPGEPFIYEGPDRAALIELHKAGEENFGITFRQNPEFLQAVRNMGFNDVEKYLEWAGYDKEKADKDFQAKIARVSKHELPKRVESINIIGGGQNTAGSGDRYGGFGEQPTT